MKVMASVYKMVMNGFPYEILRIAIEDIIFGRADGLSKTFIPSTAELRQYCENLEQQVRASVSYAKKLLTTPEEPDRSQVKLVSTERMAELLESLKQPIAGQEVF
ncbi:MAG: hypothetical protein JSC189_000445 [Candidatus Tokpelaia sp. JSC189]|nr:MAG: hypothetical protein JSC189_000445 [Candidatus Tokpelaia sp. JSC189]